MEVNPIANFPLSGVRRYPFFPRHINLSKFPSILDLTFDTVIPLGQDYLDMLSHDLNESNKEVDIQATIDAAIKIALENLEPTPTIVPTLTPTTQPTPTLTPAPTSIPTAIPEPTATPAPEPTVTSTAAPVPVSEITYEELVNKNM